MTATDNSLRTQIDQNLRRIFEEDARADLPDRLLALLDKLDEIEVPAAAGSQAASDTATDGETS